jgi:hypothetical protein
VLAAARAVPTLPPEVDVEAKAHHRQRFELYPVLALRRRTQRRAATMTLPRTLGLGSDPDLDPTRLEPLFDLDDLKSRKGRTQSSV